MERIADVDLTSDAPNATFTVMSGLIGPSEAARRLGVSSRTVQRWLRSGELPAIRVGKRLKVPASALVAGRPIRRLLVANRGELVVRIARTCRSLGITCLALVTGDQREAWWARQADEAVPLAGTYLDGDAILAAAQAAGADAIHPGYGFLAERAEFAEAVISAGLAWIGPPPAAMRTLGDKAAARRLAAGVGVPILPGYDGRGQSDGLLAREAARIGYPVLLKPSAGGGGKGMHVVRERGELREALARARREARAAFGDERLILERYLDRPRHVEVQLLLDRHGGGVHLGERDCSLQRRHQKVVEESPAPGLSAGLRERLGEAALRLARTAGYVGAGTAEFLLADDGTFVFLELNTRLQVEHPVTEAVTGLDLVAIQLRIAAGEPLGLAQADVRIDGPCHRGSSLRRGPVGRVPAGDRAHRRGGVADRARGAAGRRRRPGRRDRHALRPAAGQGRRPRARPVDGAGPPGCRAGGDKYARRDHEPRLPALAVGRPRSRGR